MYRLIPLLLQGQCYHRGHDIRLGVTNTFIYTPRLEGLTLTHPTSIATSLTYKACMHIAGNGLCG